LLSRRLSNYIKQALARGHSPAELRKRLLESGWHLETIDRYVKREKRIDKTVLIACVLVIFIGLIAFSYYSGSLTGAFTAGGAEWENKFEISSDNSQEFIRTHIVFGDYKSTVCENGIYVESNNVPVQFAVENSIYANGFCTETDIIIKNIIYSTNISAATYDVYYGLITEQSVKQPPLEEQPPAEQPPVENKTEIPQENATVPEENATVPELPQENATIPGVSTEELSQIYAMSPSTVTGTSWWNSSWVRRKIINISDTGSALTNYTVITNISYVVGMQPSFNDLRFTYYNGTDQLEMYYQKLYVESNVGMFALRVPNIAASSNTTVYMYYNNSGATDASNASATWNIYDPFDGASYNATRWETHYLGNGAGPESFTVSGGILDIYVSGVSGDEGSNTWQFVLNHTTYSKFNNLTICANMSMTYSQPFSKSYGIFGAYQYESFANRSYAYSGAWDASQFSYFIVGNDSAYTFIFSNATSAAEFFPNATWRTVCLLTNNKEGVFWTNTTKKVDNTTIPYYPKDFLGGFAAVGSYRLATGITSDVHVKVDWTGFGRFSDAISASVPFNTDLPTQGNPKLNSTTGSNLTTDNITCYNQSTSSPLGRNVTNIYNWYKNGASITVLNMPFDSDDSAGTNKTKDYSGYNHNGDKSGVIWTSSGKVGGAYNFDGISQIIDFGSTSLGLSNSMTISLWINASALTSGSYYSFLSFGGYIAGGFVFQREGTANKLRFGWAGTDSYDGPVFTTTGSWSHLAVTISNGVPQNFYVNGVATAATRSAGTGTFSATDPKDLEIGRRTDSATQYFNGTMDEVQLFNRTLSATQVNQIYLDTKDGYSSNETIVSSELTASDVWVCKMTPNDGIQDGTTSDSNNLTISSGAPTQSNPKLNSTTGNNLPTDNLTCYNQSTYSPLGRNVTNIYNWYKNGASLTVLNMPFDSDNSAGSGKTRDYSGYGNNGTKVGGVTWTSSGQVSGAYALDGSSGYITIPHNSVFNLQDFTIALWVKPGAVQIANADLLDKAHTAGSGWVIEQNGTGNWYYFTYNNGTAWQGNYLTTVNQLTAGAWQQFVIVKNGLLLTFYINGSQTKNTTSLSAIVATNTNPLWIGNYYTASGRYFNGTIDEVQIYNRSLSAAQVNQLYLDTKDGYSSKETIVSGETAGGDVWMCQVTPSDGTQDGTTLNSNNLTLFSLVNVNACQTLAAANTIYNLNQSLKGQEGANSWCLRATASNVTIDCQGYNVSANASGVSQLYGIYAGAGTQGITVRNCNVRDYSTAQIAFVSVTGANNVIQNNTAYQFNAGLQISSYGIYLSGSTANTTIINDTVRNTSTQDLYLVSTGAGNVVKDTLIDGPYPTKISLTWGPSATGSIGVKAATSPASVDPTSFKNIGKYVAVTSLSAGTWGLLNISYAAADATGVNLSSLRMSKNNGSWYTDPTAFASSSGNDSTNYYVWANITSFGSIFAPLGVHYVPTQDNPKLNATSIYNTTVDNITCYNQSTLASEGDNVTNIYNWYKNGTSRTILNMPFDSDDSAGAGTTKDYSSYGYDGTEGGVTWTPSGKVGGAYSFDGSDYITTTDIPYFNGANTKLTVAFWINDTNLSNGQVIVGKYNGATSPLHRTFLVQMHTNGILRGVAYQDGDTQNYVFFDTSQIELANNRWSHVAVVFDLSAQNIDIYVNGTEVASSKTTAGTPPTVFSDTTIPVEIGRASNPSSYLNGTLDEVRMYGSALSAAQIYQLYLDTKDSYSSSETVVSSELTAGDIWMCQVTPSNGLQDGLAKNSSNLTILGVADLLPANITYTPYGSIIGTSVTINATIKNQGIVNAGSFNVSLYVDDVYQSQNNIASLNVNASTVTTFTWAATSGLRDIEVFADSAGQITESNESNNNLTITFGVDWPMFHQTPEHFGYSNAANLSTTANVAWSFNTSGNVKSSPAIANGILYVGASSVSPAFYALNASTGVQIWNYTADSSVDSSPAIYRGAVYFDSSSKMYALNATNGAHIWNVTLGGTPSPAIYDGRVYVTSSYYIYAFNATTGAQIWNYTTGAIPITYSSPAVSNGVVYAGSDDTGILFALNAVTGAQIWNKTIAPSACGGVRSSPSVLNNIVYIIPCNGSVLALYANNGSIFWNSVISGTTFYASSPAVANNIVYIGSWGDSKLYALNATTGTKIWNYTTGSSIYSSPAIAGGIVFIGSEDKKIYALNATTGSSIWNYTTGSSIDSSPAIGPDGTVYIGSNDKLVYAFGGISDYPPTVHLVSPANGTTTNQPSQTFTCNITDDIRISNLTLYLWNSTSQVYSNTTTLSGVTNQTSWSYTWPYEGTFKWNCLGYDNKSQSNWSVEGNYTVTYADNSPVVNLISPANGNITKIQSQTFSCNITDDVQVKNLTFYIWNGTGSNLYTNTSVLSGVSNSSSYAYTLPYEDIFSWNCLGYDNLGQSDWADANYSIDLNYVPQIFFVPPTPNNDTNTSNTSVGIWINITDKDLNKLIWDWNGTNYTPYNDSLVVMFGFNNISAIGESNAVAKDVSKYGNNGTITSASYIAGVYGTALNFSGVANVQVSGLAPSLEISNEITIEAWIYTTTYVTAPIIDRRQGAPINSGYSLWLNNSVVHFYLGNGGGFDEAIGDTSLSANVWHHVIGTWRGSGNKLEIYVDGSPNGTSTNPKAGTIQPAGMTNLYVAHDTPNNAYYPGKIDEVRIYSRGMTSDEVKREYLSNFFKYDINKWQFFTNQTNLTTGAYTYYGCATDSASQTNCTDTRLLRHVPSVSNVAITAARNFTLDDLNCTGVYSDGTEANSTFYWFESPDNSVWTQLAPTTRPLDSDYTKENYYYKCQYNPSDGTFMGIPANSSSMRILPLNTTATYSSGPYNENGNVTTDTAGRLALGSPLNISGSNYLIIKSNGNMTATANITTYCLEVQQQANFTVSAVSAGQNLFIKFADLAGSGIDSNSWGFIQSIGNATYQVNFTSVNSSTPVNRWNLNWDLNNLALSASYTTFEKYGKLYVSTSNINNCVFTNANGTSGLLWGTSSTPISFKNNILTNGVYGIYMPVFYDGFDNITISNTANYSVGVNNNRLEFNRSNFALDKVYLYSSSSHVISKDHISPGNYVIWAGSGGLSKSAITYDFTSADNVTVYQGLLNINEAAAADNLTIRNVAVASTGANAITVTNNVVVSGNLTGGSADHSFGTLTINSGGKYDATSSKTAITSSANSVTTYINNGGIVNANGGMFIFQNGGTVQSAYFGTELNDVTVNKSTGIYQQTLNPTITGNLNVQQGFLTWGGGLPAGVLTVAGGVNISGFLGTTGYTAMHTGSYTFGSLTVNSGGTYDATSGNTVITSVNSNSRTIDNAGTITHNSGTVNITTASGNPPFILNGQHLYNLELSGATGHKWYGGGGATVTYVDGNMTVDTGASAQGFYNADALTVTGNALVSGTLGANSMNANINLGALTVNSGGAYYATNGTTLINGAALVGGGGKYTAGPASTFKISTASTGLRVQNAGNISVIGASSNYATMTRRDADSGNWQLTVESGAITNFTYVNISYVNATWNATATISNSVVTNAGDWTVYAGSVLKLINSIFTQLPGAIFKLFGTLILQSTNAMFGYLNLTQTGNLTMLPGANVTVQNNFDCYNQTILTNDTTVSGNLVAYSGCNITVSDGKTLSVAGTTTINSGAVIGSNSAYGLDLNGALTINSGGTLNAPNGTGTFTTYYLTNNGIFNHDNGTVNFDVSEGGYQGNNEITFYKVVVSGTGSSRYFTTNATFLSSLNNSLPGIYVWLYDGKFYTFGTSASAASISNNGVIAQIGNSGTVTIQAANANYPTACTGNDWSWNFRTNSVWKLKWLDYQIDATTGGAGTTVIFGGNMTLDGWTTSSGDTLNITTLGITITGDGNKNFVFSGAANILGNSTNYVNILGFQNFYFPSVQASTLNYVRTNASSSASSTPLWANGAAPTVSNCIFEKSSAGYGVTFSNSNGLYKFTNVTITGPSGAAYSGKHIWLYGEAGSYKNMLECDNCTFSTVGMQYRGWIVSKTHNSVLNDWRIWGVVNSSEPDNGFKGTDWTNITNVTLLNADAYSGAFSTNLVVNEVATANSININASSILNLTGGSLTTISNTYLNNSGTIFVVNGTWTNLTLADGYNTKQTIVGKNVQVANVLSAPTLNYGDNAIGKYSNISTAGTSPNAFINISYLHSDLGAANESQLELWKNNGSWYRVETTGVDTTNNYVWGNASTFSIFVPLDVNYAPNVTQVNLTAKNNFTLDDLYCNASITDADGNAPWPIFNWYRNSAPDAVLYLPFDTNATSATGAVKDYSGNNNNGTWSGGTTWTPNGELGGAYTFRGDGSGDTIAIPHNSMLEPASITVEFWAKLNSDGTRHVMVTKWTGYTTEVNSDGTFKWGLNGLPSQYFGTKTISFGQWHQLVGTFDNTTKLQCTYIDGNLSECQTASGTISYGGATLYVSWSSETNGTIDEVKIYNRALSAHQISKDYQMGLNKRNNSIIDSDETNERDTWMCQVTPNDGIADGATVNSSALQIVPLTVSDTYAGNFTEAGNMTVPNSKTLTLNTANLMIGGTTNVSGTITPGTSNMTFNGPLNVYYGGTFGGNSAYILDVNAPFTVNGTFSMPNATGYWYQSADLTFLPSFAVSQNSGTVTVDGNAKFTGSTNNELNNVIVNNGITLRTANIMINNLTLGTTSAATLTCDAATYLNGVGDVFSPNANSVVNGSSLLAYGPPGNQNIAAFNNYNSALTYIYSNSAGSVKTLKGNISIGGNLYFYSNAGSILLNVSQYQVNVTGASRIGVDGPSAEIANVTFTTGKWIANGAMNIGGTATSGYANFGSNSAWILDASGVAVTIGANGTFIGGTGTDTLGSLTINSGGFYNATSGVTTLNGAALVSSGGVYSAGPASTVKISTAGTGLRIQNAGNISVIGASGNLATMTRRDSDSNNWQLTVESGAITNFTYVNMSYLNATWNASSTISYATITNAGDWTVYANIIVKFVNSIFQQIATAVFKIFGTLILQSTNAVFGNLNLTNTGNLTMLPGANVTVQNNFYCANITTLTNTTYVGGNLTADTGCNITVASGYSLTVAGIVTVNSGATINGGNANNNFGSLTINSGGIYNAATGITNVTGATTVSGTFNASSGTMSLGSGFVSGTTFALQINNGGIFNGGSGTHTYGSVYTASGSSFIATAGTATVNDQTTSSTSIDFASGSYTHSNGTLVSASWFYYFRGRNNNFYNLIFSGSGVGYEQTSTQLNIINNLTIASATTLSFEQDPTIAMAVNGTTSISGTLTPATANITLNGITTVNSGGTLGGNTAYALDINNDLIVNSGGTLNAPNATGTFTFHGDNTGYGYATWSGTFNNDGGTVTLDGASWLVGSGSTTSPIFNNVIMGVTGSALTNGVNLTILGNLTLQTGTDYVAYGYPTAKNQVITFGNASQAGRITISSTGVLFGYAGDNLTLQGASASYPFVWTAPGTVNYGASTNNLYLSFANIQSSFYSQGTGEHVYVTGNSTFSSSLGVGTGDIWTISSGVNVTAGQIDVYGTLGSNIGYILGITASSSILRSGGTFNAPNASGSFMLTGSASMTWLAGGTFYNDGGTVYHNSGQYLVYSGSTLSPTFYDVSLGGTGTPALLYAGYNCTVLHNITSTASSLLAYGSGTPSSYLTLGNASTSGEIGGSNLLMDNVGSLYVYGANASYPFYLDTNPYWYGGVVHHFKWGNVRTDLTTSGTGTTVVFDNNMTINAFTVSAGDSLNVTTPGTVVTGNTAKVAYIYGNGTFNGNSTSYVTLIGTNTLAYFAGSTVDLRYFNYISNSANQGVLMNSGAAITVNKIDNCLFNTSTTYTPFWQDNANTDVLVSNSTFIGSNGAGYNYKDVVVGTGAKLRLDNCTLKNNAVGMVGTTGWLVSKNHNGIVNNWRIFGIVNSSVPSSGYKGSDWTNTTNVTIVNADAYSTAFNSAFTQDENVNPLQLNVTTNTNYNIVAGKNLTFPDSVGAGLASGARGTMTVSGTSANKVYIKSASGNPTNKWTGARAMNLYIDNAVIENFDSFGIGEVYNGGYVNLTNTLLQNYTGYGFLFYGNAPNYYVKKFENVTVRNGGAVGVFLGRCGAGCDWLGVNVTIDNTPPYTVQSGGYLDQDIVTFENSTFNESKVSPPYGTTTSNATFILKNHNGIVNNYEVVFAGLTPNLYYSTLYKKFGASDNVTLMSSVVTPVTLGTLYINQSANATKFVINPNTMVDVTTGSTVITTAKTQLNGSLRIDSGTWFNLTLNDIANTTQVLTANSVQVFNVLSKPADPSGHKNITKYSNMTNTSSGANALLNISYADSDLGVVNESLLEMWRYNGSWSKVPGTSVDTARNIVTANITSFSIFVPLGSVAPDAPVLLYPINSTTITSTTPTLNFTIPADPDNDTLHFIVELYNNTNLTQLLYFGNSSASTTGFNPTPPVTQGSGNMSYTNGTQLAVDHTYWWRARALDTAGNYGPWSNVENFTIISFVSCDFSQSSILFGNVPPATFDNNATLNYAGSGSSTLYNITSSSNVNVTVQSKGTNMSCIAGSCTGYIIPAYYTSWNSSKTSNAAISLPGFNLTETYDTTNLIATNLTAGSSAWLRYWIDIPDTGQPQGSYQGNYSVRCIAS